MHTPEYIRQEQAARAEAKREKRIQRVVTALTFGYKGRYLRFACAESVANGYAFGAWSNEEVQDVVDHFKSNGWNIKEEYLPIVPSVRESPKYVVLGFTEKRTGANAS